MNHASYKPQRGDSWLAWGIALGIMICLVIFGGTVSPPAAALTFGELEVLSRAGEPLRARVPVQTVDGEVVQRVAIASRADYKLLHLPYHAPVASLLPTIERRDDGTAAIHVVGPKPWQEAKDAILMLHVVSNQEFRFPYYPVRFTAPKGLSPESPELLAVPAPVIAPPIVAPLPTATTVSMPLTNRAGKRFYGPVRDNETLASIARSMIRQADQGIFQTMVAIWRANPEQFRHGNMHALNVGGLLYMPALAEIRQIDNESARQMWLEQYRKQWGVEQHAPEIELQRVLPPHQTQTSQPVVRGDETLRIELNQEREQRVRMEERIAILEQQVATMEQKLMRDTPPDWSSWYIWSIIAMITATGAGLLAWWSRFRQRPVAPQQTPRGTNRRPKMTEEALFVPPLQPVSLSGAPINLDKRHVGLDLLAAADQLNAVERKQEEETIKLPNNGRSHRG
ncbi:MAG: hypothetical protein HQL58_09795 [Magnetococcales bacterium]|nr:hypothetical protein [Magnetococcales bacterium]